MKFFLTAEIEQKKDDARWMNKATELIRLKVKDKNERAARNRTRAVVNGDRSRPFVPNAIDRIQLPANKIRTFWFKGHIQFVGYAW